MLPGHCKAVPARHTVLALIVRWDLSATDWVVGLRSPSLRAGQLRLSRSLSLDSVCMPSLNRKDRERGGLDQETTRIIRDRVRPKALRYFADFHGLHPSS